MEKTPSRTPDVDIEKCVELIGNRMNMIIIAAQRARDLQRRHTDSGNSEHRNFIIDSLLDIQHGNIGPEYIHRIK